MISVKSVHITVIFAFIFCIPLSSVASQSAKEECPVFNPDAATRSANECFHSLPGLGKLFQNATPIDSLMFTSEVQDMICLRKADVARAFMCYQDKHMLCVPLELRDTVIEMMPDQARWLKAFDFLCNNRDNLESYDCFDITENRFQNCITKETEATSVTTQSPQGVDENEVIKDSINRLTGAIHTCLRKFRGTCSDALVDTLAEFMDIVMPYNGAVHIGVTVFLIAASLFISGFNLIV